jgi:hypothetical protein
MLAVAVTSGEPAEKLAGPHVIAAIADYRGADPRHFLDLAARTASRAA